MPPDGKRLAELLRAARQIAVVGLSPRPERPSHGVAAAAAGPIDVVDVFRRSQFVSALVDPMLAIHPRLVWMQVGVRDDQAARRLEAAGIAVVMNRCLAVDHQSLGA